MQRTARLREKTGIYRESGGAGWNERLMMEGRESVIRSHEASCFRRMTLHRQAEESAPTQYEEFVFVSHV